MGLFDDDDFELDELLDSVISYPSCVAELNGGIVQEIFSRCIATDSTTVYTKAYFTFQAALKDKINTDIEEQLKNATPEQIAKAKTEAYAESSKDGLFDLVNEKCSQLILFDETKIIENLKQIKYLYGQLKTTHECSNTFSIGEDERVLSMTNYAGKKWTENTDYLEQLFYLGIASQTIYPFSNRGNSGFQNVGIQPTLSPKDSNFPAWWEEHKAEWE